MHIHTYSIQEYTHTVVMGPYMIAVMVALYHSFLSG